MSYDAPAVGAGPNHPAAAITLASSGQRALALAEARVTRLAHGIAGR